MEFRGSRGREVPARFSKGSRGGEGVYFRAALDVPGGRTRDMPPGSGHLLRATVKGDARSKYTGVMYKVTNFFSYCCEFSVYR